MLDNLISATVVKDSSDGRGNRITTYKLVFPRYILAELNTHRLFSKNSASSRAIPFKKMVKSVMDNPFIPIAFQKEHTGMQGSEYLDIDTPVRLCTFKEVLTNVFKFSDEKADYILNPDNTVDFDETLCLIFDFLEDADTLELSLKEWWLYCRDQALKTAILMSALGVTKQLCNRILEPFLYHTVLLTATEYYNFFKLRCPKYEIGLTPDDSEVAVGKSWRELMEWRGTNGMWAGDFETDNTVERLSYNKGAGEIHIMELAEKMYDALNESEPQLLAEGEWHIPYDDNIDYEELGRITAQYYKDNTKEIVDIDKWVLKIATARMARISYETLGDNPKIDYEADIKLHDDLIEMEHWSPAEHCARVMTSDEYYSKVKGEFDIDYRGDDYVVLSRSTEDDAAFGWSKNFKGFIQYREIVEKGLQRR